MEKKNKKEGGGGGDEEEAADDEVCMRASMSGCVYVCALIHMSVCMSK